MLIHLGFDIRYRFTRPTPMLVMLELRDERMPDVLRATPLQAGPNVALQRYRDGFGNHCARLLAPTGELRLHADAVIRDSGLPDPVVPHAREVPVDALPDDVLVFLLASRYCETDLLMQQAWALFGDVAPGWNRVQAICDYVHARIRFGYPYADSRRGAAGALQDGQGVCRDFAHSAIALCRCMNIPARYCSGYLGDIGVPRAPAPMDFSAWFEAFLDGNWYTFDARHNLPRIGRVPVARGRDAADAAISTTFGFNTLEKFEVWTDELDANAPVG